MLQSAGQFLANVLDGIHCLDGMIIRWEDEEAAKDVFIGIGEEWLRTIRQSCDEITTSWFRENTANL